VSDVEMFLVAVKRGVDPDEIRRFWNANESPTLHAVIRDSPRIRLGVTEAPCPGNERRRGPVGRVFDLVFLRGTTPVYCLPVLDETLKNEILLAMAPKSGDPPFDTEAIDQVANFLTRHLGLALVIEDVPPSPEPGGTCPQCAHLEADHAYWSPDAVCDGWAHCKVGSGEDACQCWRSWPRLSAPEAAR
jgi:hypothetical protein